ncbi:MFS transporter [Tenuibacillus multivorans]|uniref:MFS transporter, UMF1 family n=1 Tax=Tenuibacillus multivorans TaxID=237069 RepID=A0A1H0DTQ5_9BACI|nr:MFS transporter [Tenuibacillus multivorans]GEL76784.1 MFS transporter [Tenuibacillus multivorans]SDN73426.1 MFS transporter, UMF1 family [Tenuibacillus multivorans]
MDKKLQRSWMMYDWANSAFATTIMAAVFPVFYESVAAVTLAEGTATSYFSFTQSIAVLIAAVLAPVLGAIADFSAAKMKFLKFFAFMGMTASVLLVTVNEGDYILASILFIIASVGFSGGNVFYDAFLPSVAKKEEIDRVSTSGFAFGYIGGGLLLAVNLLMITQYEMFGFPNEKVASQLAFVSVGLWWFIFSIPLFKNVKEEKSEQKVRQKSYVKIGFSRIGDTFKTLRHYKQLLIFILAFWMFSDGISTIIRMATFYGATIGIDSNDLIAALLITQFVGIPCTFFFSKLAKWITAKKALTFALSIYVVIVILGYFMESALHFYLLAICVGFVQGGAQALSRSIFARMVPRNKQAEFFGFYGITSKFAAILGPAVFGFAALLTESSRLGILSLLIFFVAGITLLQFVNIEQGEREAKAAEDPSDIVNVQVK